MHEVKKESVWDYPRPPRMEPVTKRLKVVFNGEVVAETNRAFRILETSHPPTYYFPPEDVKMAYLTPTRHSTFCEFKGMAAYWTLKAGERVSENAAWSYPSPSVKYKELKNYISFYASRVDACYVDEEKVAAQAGDFYGGWITSDIEGPFKGGSGTWGW